MSKKAILVASFGTTYIDTRKATIDAIENDIKAAFPDFEIRRAFTSSIVRKRILKNEGIDTDDMDRALERLKEDGFDEVYVSSLHIISGSEYSKVTHSVARHRKDFKMIKTAKPLLYSKPDYDETIEAIEKSLPELSEGEAVLFMGHGSEHHANAAYVMLEYLLKKNKSTEHVYMGTVEGYPELEDIMEDIEDKGYKKLYLLPFMIVAGDHATNDMASDEEDSWKSILQENGYQTESILKGLGQYKDIRNIFIERLNAIME